MASEKKSSKKHGTQTIRSIQSESDLEALRNSALHQFRKYKIQTVNHPKKSKAKENKSSVDKPMVNGKDDEKEGYFKEYTTKDKKYGYEWQQMYADVSEMENSINIKGTDLEKALIALEKRLTSQSAKRHISRKCHYHSSCKETAPSLYPNNLYLCDKHRKPLYKKLESYEIRLNKGSAKEQEKCKKLNDCHQKIISALKISDSEQSFGNNQHKYPPNYFTVCMSKLLLCQQESAKPLPSNSDSTLRDSHQKMKKIVTKLMDSLIAARQNLNDHWLQVLILIISQCTTIQPTIAWMEANSAYIAELYEYLRFIMDAIVVGFIFGEMHPRDATYVRGAAAVGAGVGAIVYGTAETGAILGAPLGPPGIIVGGVVGGLIGGGLAAMYKYG